MSDEQRPTRVSPWQALVSVFRAWFGVQTDANRQRDFASNNASSFIIAGVIFTVGLVLAVVIAVNAVLP
ncbi:DUF2970 family protein [Paraperlucidibaca baekdonensis]|uniref:DUF2970 family protein n=1 Tax=Paraperlucidibaca baekdonensis TaxID=748120 RepID=A0A3E0H374_9GAMM|nr:DUF2970 domain-containing protein [Paraperlucidibaca baekdonensis]REH37758.1 DUF2970 family protein [Paraperlucidibaca baekdonensis]